MIHRISQGANSRHLRLLLRLYVDSRKGVPINHTAQSLEELSMLGRSSNRPRDGAKAREYIYVDDTIGAAVRTSLDHDALTLTIVWMFPVAYFRDGSPNPAALPAVDFFPMLGRLFRDITAEQGERNHYKRSASFSGVPRRRSRDMARSWASRFPGAIAQAVPGHPDIWEVAVAPSTMVTEDTQTWR